MLQSRCRILFLSLIAACQPVKNDESGTSGFAKLDARWPDQQNIPVCWDDAKGISPKLLEAYQRDAIREYHGKTNVRFTRFDHCTAADYAPGASVIRVGIMVMNDAEFPQVRIAGVTRYGPRIREMGDLSGSGIKRVTRASLVLVAKTAEAAGNWSQNRLDALGSTFLHELGHAIGLIHEHQREDVRNCGVVDPNNPQTKGMMESAFERFVGGYDPDSLLNYCRQRKPLLTPGDVAAVNFLYPKVINIAPSSENFVIRSAATRKCLVTKGVALDIQDCSQENWKLQPQADGSFLVSVAGSNLCLDQDMATKTVKLSPCASTMTQAIYIKMPDLRSLGLYLANPSEDVKLRQLQFATTEACLTMDYDSRSFQGKVVLAACELSGTNRSVDGQESIIEFLGNI